MALDENACVLETVASSSGAFVGDSCERIINDFKTLLTDAGTPIQVFCIHEEIVVKTSCSFIGFSGNHDESSDDPIYGLDFIVFHLRVKYADFATEDASHLPHTELINEGTWIHDSL
jgi:hypothetical protein